MLTLTRQKESPTALSGSEVDKSICLSLFHDDLFCQFLLTDGGLDDNIDLLCSNMYKLLIYSLFLLHQDIRYHHMAPLAKTNYLHIMPKVLIQKSFS